MARAVSCELEMWTTVWVEEVKRTHVVPLEDLREHDLTPTCWCHPEQHDDESIVVHMSMDGREAYETGERKPS